MNGDAWASVSGRAKMERKDRSTEGRESSYGIAVSVQRCGEWDGFRLLASDKKLTCFKRAVTDSYSLLSPETPEPTQSERPSSAPSMDYIQGSRHMLEMTRNLFDEVAEEGAVRYQRVDKQLATVSMIRNGEMG
jgi:hypothetical protein